MIKESQFNTRPPGPILVLFSDAGKKKKINKAALQQSAEAGPQRRPEPSQTPPRASRRRDDEMTRCLLRSGRGGWS